MQTRAKFITNSSSTSFIFWHGPEDKIDAKFLSEIGFPEVKKDYLGATYSLAEVAECIQTYGKPLNTEYAMDMYSQMLDWVQESIDRARLGSEQDIDELILAMEVAIPRVQLAAIIRGANNFTFIEIEGGNSGGTSGEIGEAMDAQGINSTEPIMRLWGGMIAIPHH